MGRFVGSRKARLWVVLVLAVAFHGRTSHGQIAPAATRPVNVQAGASINLFGSDYSSRTLYGAGAYATADFTPHIGAELSFHRSFDVGAAHGITETTYEIGPRYVFHFNRFAPYAKLLVGRGVFQFPPDPQHPGSGPVANLAFNIWTPGFGTDVELRPHLNFRADYELQQWNGFPPHGLSPRVFNFGFAYHFH